MEDAGVVLDYLAQAETVDPFDFPDWQVEVARASNSVYIEVEARFLNYDQVRSLMYALSEAAIVAEGNDRG